MAGLMPSANTCCDPCADRVTVSINLADVIGEQITARYGIVSVKDFGATGNGTTDDTGALLAAIASLGGNPGQIQLPTGIYSISDTLVLGNGQMLVGSSNRLAYNLTPPATVGAEIRYTGSGVAIACSGECTVLKNLVVVATNNLTGTGISLHNAGGFFYLERVFFYRFNIGLLLTETINGLINDCSFRDCDIGATTAGTYNNIITFAFCNFLNNRVGVDVASAASNIDWFRCTIESNTDHGLVFSGGGGSCRITKVWFEANGGTTGSAIHVNNVGVDGVLIAGNWFQNHFNAVRHTAGVATIIRDNYFPTNTLPGAPSKCEIVIGASSYHVHVTANYFRFDHDESTSISDSGNYTSRFNNFIGDTALATANDGLKSYGFIRHLRASSTPGATEKGILGVHPTDSNTGLSAGGFLAAPFATWLQSIDQRSGNATTYPLSLNPVGGNVGVHTPDPVAPFTVVPSPGGDVNQLGLAAFFNPDATTDGRFTTAWIGKASIAGQAGVWSCRSAPGTPANCVTSICCYGDNEVTEGVAVWKGGTVGIGPATADTDYKLHIVGGAVGALRCEDGAIFNDYVKIFPLLPAFANNGAALGGGLSVGQLYRTGADPDVVCIVHP